MNVTIHRNRTVRDLLSQAQERYGSRQSLERFLEEHPHDVMAKLALHDWAEYENDDPGKVIRETREVIIPDSAIDQLTVQRLQLLLTIKGLRKAGPGVRALARAVKRDIKNVSEDVRVLSELGLLEVQTAGKGKAHRISLPGDRIDLHLVEAGA